MKVNGILYFLAALIVLSSCKEKETASEIINYPEAEP